MDIRWRARYFDGSYLDQYCKCGFPRGYPNIERDKLSAFEIIRLVPKTKENPDGEVLIFRMFLEEDQRLIYRRRVQKRLLIGGGVEERAIYLVGWQQKINGKNIQSINYVFEDGHVEQAGKWVGGVPKLRPEER